MKDLVNRIKSLNKNRLVVLASAVTIIVALVISLSIQYRGYKRENKDETVELNPAAADDYKDAGDSNMSNVVIDQRTDKGPWSVLTDKEYNIHIDAVDGGYTGRFVEDGSDDEVSDVLALKFTNNGDRPIQYAEYVFGIDNEAVSFKLTDLPAGESCVVLEMNRRAYDRSDVLELTTRVVACTDQLPNEQDKVLIVDNSDNTITLMNLTDQDIQNIRVFYKNYNDELECYLGGITYSGTVESISAGDQTAVAPAHYISGTSVIMGNQIS